MSNSWLDYPTTSNLFKQSYIKDFLDVSGDLYVRNNNINGIGSDISMNGSLTCNSLTLTEGTGAGINSDVQTALDGKQDLLISGTGIDISNDTISLNSGANENITQTQSEVYESSVSLSATLLETNFYYPASYATTSSSTLNWSKHTLAMSGDGNTIATGLENLDNTQSGPDSRDGGASIITKSGSGWINKGSFPQVAGPYASDLGGAKGFIQLSYDGNTIMLGTTRLSRLSLNDTDNTYFGLIYVYKYTGSNWVIKGNVITGYHREKINGVWTHNYDTAYGDMIECGDMTDDGNTVIIRSRNHENGSPYPTELRIADYDTSSDTWVLRSIIEIHDNNSWNGLFSGVSDGRNFARGYGSGQHPQGFCLSPDGNTLAINAKLGFVMILDYNNDEWHLRSTIYAPEGWINYGGEISLTKDTNTILIADFGVKTVYIYDWDGTAWNIRGAPIVSSVSYFGYFKPYIMNNGNYAIIPTYGTMETYVYYWNGSVWSIVSGTPIVYGVFLSGGSQDILKIALARGTGAREIKIYELPYSSSNSTDVSGNLYISGNLDVSGGDITVSGSTVHSSDIRLKTNIELLSNSLNNILKLNPELYNKKKYINEDLTVSNLESGFIAQEIWYNIPELRHLVVLPDGVTAENIQDMSLNRVKPEYIDIYDISTNGIIDPISNQIIHTNEDGTETYEDIIDPNDYSDKTPDYEAYGWSNKPASVNYEGLIAYLVGAIQELKEKITIQSSEIDVLVG